MHRLCAAVRREKCCGEMYCIADSTVLQQQQRFAALVRLQYAWPLQTTTTKHLLHEAICHNPHTQSKRSSHTTSEPNRTATSKLSTLAPGSGALGSFHTRPVEQVAQCKTSRDLHHTLAQTSQPLLPLHSLPQAAVTHTTPITTRNSTPTEQEGLHQQNTTKKQGPESKAQQHQTVGDM